jgi:hypothetical protein
VKQHPYHVEYVYNDRGGRGAMLVGPGISSATLALPPAGARDLSPGAGDKYEALAALLNIAYYAGVADATNGTSAAVAVEARKP